MTPEEIAAYLDTLAATQRTKAAEAHANADGYEKAAIAARAEAVDYLAEAANLVAAADKVRRDGAPGAFPVKPEKENRYAL